MKKDFRLFKDFIKGKKTAVVGIGVSNIPLINFLLQLGAEVTAFDKKTVEELGDTAEEFMNKGVAMCLGKDYLTQLRGFEVVFKSPSMRIDSEALQQAKKEGAYITSEMEEFIRYCPAKIYGITGSDGKTTTTTIVYNLLTEQGYKTWVGGNIGIPLFSKIEEISKEDKVVLELSSFQLMTIDTSPEVAVVTNVTPNHLDMHKGMEEYVDSKKNIFRYQTEDNLLILNRDNEITNSFTSEAKGRLRLFSRRKEVADGGYYKDGKLYVCGEEICSKEDIVIKGMHNVENYLAAFLAVRDDVSREVMVKIASTFKGVEHRNEFIREVNGVKYYNDSIGSSPTRTLATISVFDRPVILIAGGYDKHIPFEPLAENGIDKIESLVLLGDTKNKIYQVFQKVMEERKVNTNIYMVDTLEEAVLKCKEISKQGDYVVLSPACASFDMFPNFEVRGNRFKDIVANL